VPSAAPSIRPAAVAGYFYPADPTALEAELDRYFAECGGLAKGEPDAVPKAIIAPHAGTIYSGPIAASAYRLLAPARGRITRVVLLGPAHRVGFRGLAAPSVDAFATPFGPIPLDRPALDALAALPQVRVFDDAHAQEHSLEVHLPFLKTVLGDFTLVPLVVGLAGPEEVAELLEKVWGGPETLIVISSDLSHFHDYDTARRLDGRTCQAIERLDDSVIDGDGACGVHPISGLLTLCRRKGLTAETLDLRNSGDTAGDKSRVVGYGAWRFDEPGGKGLSDDDQETLLDITEQSIEHGLAHGSAKTLDPNGFSAALQAMGASFVTLKKGGDLRGCIGSLEAHRPLSQDTAANAYSAAFADPRFPALTADEWPAVDISVSVLGEPEPLAPPTEDALLAALRPGIDGLILRDGRHRATFLPQVWESLPAPRDFVGQLKRKAGLATDHWSDSIRIWRYGSQNFARKRAL